MTGYEMTGYPETNGIFLRELLESVSYLFLFLFSLWPRNNNSIVNRILCNSHADVHSDLSLRSGHLVGFVLPRLSCLDGPGPHCHHTTKWHSAIVHEKNDTAINWIKVLPGQETPLEITLVRIIGQFNNWIKVLGD